MSQMSLVEAPLLSHFRMSALPPKADIAARDWHVRDDRTIDSHVKRLRRKFKASDNEFDMIETLYGVGYRFKEL